MKESPTTATRLRAWMFAVSVVMGAGIVAELLLTEHTDGWPQRLPIALCALLVGLVLWAWFNPDPRTIIAGQFVAALVAVVGLIGLYFHIDGNYVIDRDLNPDDPIISHMWEAIRGPNPPLVPGSLVALAVIAAGALYRHPGNWSSRGGMGF